MFIPWHSYFVRVPVEWLIQFPQMQNIWLFLTVFTLISTWQYLILGLQFYDIINLYHAVPCNCMHVYMFVIIATVTCDLWHKKIVIFAFHGDTGRVVKPFGTFFDKNAQIHLAPVQKISLIHFKTIFEIVFTN